MVIFCEPAKAAMLSKNIYTLLRPPSLLASLALASISVRNACIIGIPALGLNYYLTPYPPVYSRSCQLDYLGSIYGPDILIAIQVDFARHPILPLRRLVQYIFSKRKFRAILCILKIPSAMSYLDPSSFRSLIT